MAADGSSTRSAWFVPVLVAVIGALATIGVALISIQNNDSEVTTAVDLNGSVSTPESSAPDIGGDYYLDPGNSRVILLTRVGDDSYSIVERPPTSWPFSGTVGWTADGEFTGIATFDSGSRMRVTLEPMPDGTLLTSFAFITDDQGVSTTREDKHVLVPVN